MEFTRVTVTGGVAGEDTVQHIKITGHTSEQIEICTYVCTYINIPYCKYIQYMVTSHNVGVHLELFYTTYKQTVVLTAEVAIQVQYTWLVSLT